MSKPRKGISTQFHFDSSVGKLNDGTTTDLSNMLNTGIEDFSSRVHSCINNTTVENAAVGNLEETSETNIRNV